MRCFALLLAVAASLASTASAVSAQPSPTPAYETNTVITDGPGTPATSPHAYGRRASLRRDAGSAVQKPPEAPLAANGAATLGMMTGGLHGTFVQIGSDVATVASSDALRVVPLIGKGSLQNLADLLNLRSVDLALVSADSAWSTEASGLYSGLRSRVHYIAKLYDQEVHILAAPDVYIVADLANKTVNVGLMGSGTAVTAPAVFDSMHVAVKLAHDIPTVALEKLKRGEIAALVYGSCWVPGW